MEIVQDNKSYNRACKLIKKQSIIYLDTEFLRDKTYWPILCLIQIKTARKTFIFDFIKKNNFDLIKLKKIFENKEILKVIHSCKQDLEVLFLNFDTIIYPIFDTQIAYAQLTDMNSIGYTSLVKILLKKGVKKDQQISDWSRRPLSKTQLQYAANDVKYLPKLYNLLSNQIIIKKKKKNFEDEINRLKFIKNIYKTEDSWKKIKIKKKSNININLLKIFSEWREKKAQILNLPRNWIITDKIIIKASKKIKINDFKEPSENKRLNQHLKEFNLFLKSEKFI